MDELLAAKQAAFYKKTRHEELELKHHDEARKAHYELLRINDQIRAVERGEAKPIKVVYGA